MTPTRTPAPTDERSAMAAGHTIRTEANSRLTATAGLVLFVLLAALGVTILRIHRLLTAHVVIGFALLGPLAVKLASTGWRFLRYYRGDGEYIRTGPPRPLLRALAPFVVLTTALVMVSGIALIATGPNHPGPLVLVHKASFILWFGCLTIHVLAYLLPATRWCLADLAGRGPRRLLAGRRFRQAAMVAGILAGAALGAGSAGWAHAWAVHLAHGGDH